MEEWPFTNDEWDSVSGVCLNLVNAQFARDEVLHDSLFVELCALIKELVDKYGPHPVLFETEADFTHDPKHRVALYELAKEAALAGGWATYSIRLSLARILLEDFRNADRAKEELLACEGEMESEADAGDQKDWTELFEINQKEWKELFDLCFQSK